MVARASSFSLEFRDSEIGEISEISEAALRRFYAATTPGGPPLESIREYVAAAYLKAKTPDSSLLDLHLLATLAFDALPAGVPRPRELCEWTAADVAVAKLRALHAAIGPALVPATDIREQLLEQVFIACDHIASRGTECRLVEIPRDSTDRAVFDSIGIVPRPRKRIGDNGLADLAAVSERMTEFRFKHRKKPEAYITLVTTLMELACGHLPIEDLGGAIEIERRWATLHFTLDGKQRDYVPRYLGEWMDRQVVTWIDRLLRERGEGWGFYGVQRDKHWIVFACDRADFCRLTAAGTACRPVATLL